MAESAARWIEVGASMLNLDRKWVTMRGSRPRPRNVVSSVSGALLGAEDAFDGRDFSGVGTAGLWEKREEII